MTLQARCDQNSKVFTKPHSGPNMHWMSNAIDLLLQIAEINVCHLRNFRILHQGFRVQKFPVK